jgi:hypothetical protein
VSITLTKRTNDVLPKQDIRLATDSRDITKFAISLAIGPAEMAAK